MPTPVSFDILRWVGARHEFLSTTTTTRGRCAAAGETRSVRKSLQPRAIGAARRRDRRRRESLLLRTDTIVTTTYTGRKHSEQPCATMLCDRGTVESFRGTPYAFYAFTVTAAAGCPYGTLYNYYARARVCV